MSVSTGLVQQAIPLSPQRTTVQNYKQKHKKISQMSCETITMQYRLCFIKPSADPANMVLKQRLLSNEKKRSTVSCIDILK